MSKSRCSNLAAIGPFAAIADNKHAHLALGCFNGGISLSRRDRVAFREEKEVVDEGLHVLLHGGAWRRRDLVVFHADRAWGHFVQALMDDSQTLAELFHAAEVAIVAVSVDTDRHVKFHLIIGIVRLALAHIPRHTTATKHHTTE